MPPIRRSEGCRSLESLRSWPGLTDAQRVGLQYYDDMQRKIPREEVTRIFEVVKAAAHAVGPPGNPPSCTAAGSYRRGKPESGDVDVIITKFGEWEGLLLKIVAQLKAQGAPKRTSSHTLPPA